MPEPLRFDFSRPSLSETHVPTTSSPYWRRTRAFLHQPGRAARNIPPAIRLAFLVVVCLTAGVCSYAVTTLLSSTVKAGASENGLPAPTPSSKLKTANLLPGLPPIADVPAPLPPSDIDVSLPPPQLPGDSDVSLPVQLPSPPLPPVAVDVPLPPVPLVEEAASELAPAPVQVFDPAPAFDPVRVFDPEVAYDPRPEQPASIDLLPPDPLPVVVKQPTPPVFERPPEVVAEKAPEAKPVELPPDQPMPANVDDETILIYLQHGESPMLHNWKHLRLAAVLAAALATPPAVVAQDENKTDIKAILDQLRSMDGEIKLAFKTLNSDVKSLDDDIKRLKSDMGNLQMNLLTQGKDVESLAMKVGELDRAVKQLTRDFDEHRQKLPGEIAIFAPVTKESFDDLRMRVKELELKLAETQSSKRIALAPSTTGRIMLVNLYNEDLVFTVNGQTFRVPAGRTVPVENVPVGAVTYEMISPTWGRRANTQTNLTANETLTLTAQ